MPQRGPQPPFRKRPRTRVTRDCSRSSREGLSPRPTPPRDTRTGRGSSSRRRRRQDLLGGSAADAPSEGGAGPGQRPPLLPTERPPRGRPGRYAPLGSVGSSWPEARLALWAEDEGMRVPRGPSGVSSPREGCGARRRGHPPVVRTHGGHGVRTRPQDSAPAPRSCRGSAGRPRRAGGGCECASAETEPAPWAGRVCTRRSVPPTPGSHRTLTSLPPRSPHFLQGNTCEQKAQNRRAGWTVARDA